MGNVVTKHYTLVDHPQFAELLATPFTVLRNPNAEHREKWEQEGWRIDAAMHSTVCNAQSWEYSKFARSSGGEHAWKVVMSNALDNPNTHACGWRRVGEFWPTDLPFAQREGWTLSFKAQLDALSSAADLVEATTAMSVLK